MEFLDTYESILIWQLRNGIKVVDDYEYLFNQLGSYLYVPYEDDKTNYRMRNGSNPRLSYGSNELTKKDKLYLKAMIPILQEEELLEKPFTPISDEEWVYLAEVDDDYLQNHIPSERDANDYDSSLITTYQTLLGNDDKSWGQTTPLTWEEITTFKFKVNIFDPYETQNEVEPVTMRLEDAVAAEDIVDPNSNEIIVRENQVISKNKAEKIAESDLDSVYIYFRPSDIQDAKDYENYWEEFKAKHIRPFL